MTKPTVSAAGGAMPRVITRNNLIDAESGEVNVWALKALARREAMATYGAICPRSLRSALREVSGLIPELQCAWRQAHGLPIESTTVTAYGKPRVGAGRSAF